MKISVVIPSIDRPTLQQTLDSLHDADEVIVQKDTTKQFVQNTLEGIEKATGDVLLYTSDRSIFLPGWREAVEKGLERINNHGVISFFSNLVAYGGATRSYLTTLGGHLLWPDYLHYFCDQELGERGRRDHSYVEVLNVVQMLPKPENDTSKAWDDKCAIQDRETYYRRESAGFPNKTV